MKTIRKVALYCRVSTGEQSTAMQIEELRRMAEARGWEVAAVVEEMVSGRKTRPARKQLIRDAKAGKYDAVLVWKMSRWGRSTVDLVTTNLAAGGTMSCVAIASRPFLSPPHSRPWRCGRWR